MNKRLRAKDVEAEFGIKRFQVYRLCELKKIPHVKIGKMIIFDKNELDAWFQEHKIDVRKK
ncbi:MAG: helix-turn-helix domain-containing protein [Nitrospirae bacterium]|nr:helix-turn-helix domain-containing protein [Nitrospirota bacterium]